MKYKNKMYGVIVALTCTLWVSDVFAIGIGFGVMQGNETWDDNNFFRTNDGDRDISSLGFILDTNIARDRLFNYRLTVAREDNEASKNDGIDLEGTTFTNDFGFAVYRSNIVKLWLGPQVKLGFYKTTLNENTALQVDGAAIGWGFGPVIGINVHLPKVVSFSASFAYHLAGFYVGDYDRYSDTVSADDIDVDYEGGTYLNLSVLFRFGSDNYK